MNSAISTRKNLRGPSIVLAIFGLFPIAVHALAARTAAARQEPKTEAQPIIERIEVIGNRRVEMATIREDILSRPGQPYNPAAVAADILRLWNTHFFADLRVETENAPDRPNDKVVIFYVREQPIIRRIEYKGIKSVAEQDILNAFKAGNIPISVETRFDPDQVAAAVVLLRALLAVHGHPSATVTTSCEKIFATDAIKLEFDVDEGPSQNEQATQ
jgi:outer membrane protein insertion porin family